MLDVDAVDVVNVDPDAVIDVSLVSLLDELSTDGGGPGGGPPAPIVPPPLWELESLVADELII